MVILNYASKKEIAAAIGSPLDFTETCFRGPELTLVGHETLVGCNRPQLSDWPKHVQRVGGYTKAGKLRTGREFYAEITLDNGVIKEVK